MQDFERTLNVERARRDPNFRSGNGPLSTSYHLFLVENVLKDSIADS